jgi:hypothetical protein
MKSEIPSLRFMSTKAPASLLDYEKLKEWLAVNGVPEHKMRHLITQGTIQGQCMPAGNVLYDTGQVKRDVLDPLEDLMR